MPSFHNEPNQLLGLPWPHPYVPYESLHIVIPAIQGLIDFLPTIEAKFVNLAPSLKQFSNSNQTTHDCLKQQLKMCQYWPRPRKMYGLPPNSRKPRGHKILKLNLSSLSHMIQGGPPAYQWTWPYSIMTLLRLICHQTDESEDPEITSGQPNPTTHPSLVFAHHPHVPMYKSWSPQPLLIIPNEAVTV